MAALRSQRTSVAGKRKGATMGRCTAAYLTLGAYAPGGKPRQTEAVSEAEPDSAPAARAARDFGTRKYDHENDVDVSKIARAEQERYAAQGRLDELRRRAVRARQEASEREIIARYSSSSR